MSCNDPPISAQVMPLMHTPQRVSSSPAPGEAAECCTTQQQNAHITDQREVLYRWHPWHGRTVSIVSATVRSGVATFRCRADDSSRCFEVPQWMFDAAACCHTQLGSQAIVACRALYDLRDLIQATERIHSKPVLLGEHPSIHAAGGAHAIQKMRKTLRLLKSDKARLQIIGS